MLKSHLPIHLKTGLLFFFSFLTIGVFLTFSNGFAASGSLAAGNAMPLPRGGEFMPITTPAMSPVINIDPAKATPFGFGSAASGGNILSLTAGIGELTAPADLYLAMSIGQEIYLFASDGSLHLLTDGVKWRANTTGGINERILPDIDISHLPSGTYTFYFFMTPAGRMDTYRMWAIPLVIGGGASGVTDKAMEQDIKQYMDLLFGTSDSHGMSLVNYNDMVTEFTTIFSDQNIATISPANLDLSTILSGAPITINVNFGSGYTLTSGTVMRGNLQAVISNVKFTDQGIGADMTITFHNIMQDGVPLANGQVSASLLLTEISDEQADISGQITFSNFTDNKPSGTIQISGTIDGLDLSSVDAMTGTVRLTFANFILGAYTINSGDAAITINQDSSSNLTFNMQTSQGPVTLDMVSTTTQDGVTLNTSTPGTLGIYSLTISNLTLGQSSCTNYPAGGTVSFTSNSTGATGVVTFTGACDGPYGYSER